MRKRVELEPTHFTPGWRSLAALVFSSLGTGCIAALAASFAGHDFIASIAFIIGCVVGVIFVAPLLVPMVLAKSFWPTVMRVMGTAMVFSCSLAIVDSVSYPSLSLLGGVTGMVAGAIWAWLVVPSYVNVVDKVTCQFCGYSLVGLDHDAVCPECGQTREAKRHA